MSLKFLGSAALAIIVGQTAFAENSKFSLSIRGFKVGEITYQADQSLTRYAVNGHIGNTGLTRVVRRFSFKGQVSGRVSGLRLYPDHYQEFADTGKRQSEVVLKYQNNVPEVVTYTSPTLAGPDAPAPSTQKGSVDPLSAIYGLLRSVAAEDACKVNFDLFDGKRSSRIRTKLKTTENGLPVCVGFYERLLGFRPEEVARHKRFDFTMRYRQGDDGKLNVDNVVFQSIYGKASIDRQ